MTRRSIRILDAVGSPESIGHAHGTAYSDEIRQYLDERVGLVMEGSWSGGPMSRGAVLDLAGSMVPAHEAHHPALAAEMMAMAAAADITPGEAVIVGGFTDFVDTVRAAVGGAHPESVMEDDCTAAIVPDNLAGGAGFFAQTWDMHDTATDHVILLRVRPDDAPAALVFTTTGALGQIGMNELGVCVGINNLTATDGVAGVTWPQVVRAALEAETAEGARDAILDADLAGGHNFSVFDATGVGYDIEAMPSARPVRTLGSGALVHTNHSLHPDALAVQGARSPLLMDSSERRLDVATSHLDRDDIDVDDLFDLLREPSAVCQVAVEPYNIESSGAAVMRPRTREFWACWGRPDQNEFEKIGFS
ncbi:MAG: C45 family autoproteolytic acyltransferase/hydrolase [Acidimicrobiales bacterium]